MSLPSAVGGCDWRGGLRLRSSLQESHGLGRASCSLSKPSAQGPIPMLEPHTEASSPSFSHVVLEFSPSEVTRASVLLVIICMMIFKHRVLK